MTPLSFNQTSFTTMTIPGLDERMASIREHIQPVFQWYGNQAVDVLTEELQEPMYLHIAQHRRRTANAPDFTWSAISYSKRGYKRYPHFTLGITATHIVIWLSLIDNPDEEVEIGKTLLKNSDLFDDYLEKYQLNLDHTKNDYATLTRDNLEKGLTRFCQVKKGEFQIGRVLTADDVRTQTSEEVGQVIIETYQSLLPIYHLACKVQQEKGVTK